MSNLIYLPKGAAGEYAKYAVNFLTGCPGRCSYCYNRKGITAKVLGGDIAQLRKCFSSESEALAVFEKELKSLPEEDLRRHGIFFSFVSDPMLPQCFTLIMSAVSICVKNNIPVMLLTKQTWWVKNFIHMIDSPWELNPIAFGNRKLVGFGFTLTGHDEMEPGAAPNQSRIEAMKALKRSGFRTWASIEPVIDIESSKRMVEECIGFCDHMKIGLLSGKKFTTGELSYFFAYVNILAIHKGVTVYWKDSFIKQTLFGGRPKIYNCVSSDYSMFLQGDGNHK